MRHVFTTWLACLVLVFAMSMAVAAQEGPSAWDKTMPVPSPYESAQQTRDSLTTFPVQDPSPMPPAPVTLSQTDPDRTSYPYINNWKGNLVRDPKCFFNDTERQNLTQSRVDLVGAVSPLFLVYQDLIRMQLTHDQINDFEAVVVTQDLERLAVMTDNDCDAYVALLSQRVHLDACQEADVHNIMTHLMTRIRPLQEQYAVRVDQQIAMAEQRVIAERAARNAAISTGAPETEKK